MRYRRMCVEGVQVACLKMETLLQCQIGSYGIMNSMSPITSAKLLSDITHSGWSLNSMDSEQILLQAQALLRKNFIFQELEHLIRRASVFRASVYAILPSEAPGRQQQQQQPQQSYVTAEIRDCAVSNMRFLNLFYGFPNQTFALAVLLLDRLLVKVKVNPQYLPVISAACFSMATQWTTPPTEASRVPTRDEIVRLTQCCGKGQDLKQMEDMILARLELPQPSRNTCPLVAPPLSFLKLFCQAVGDKCSVMTSPGIQNALFTKLDILLCHTKFTKFRAETLALCLLVCMLDDTRLLHQLEVLNTILELQYYCQISDAERNECHRLISEQLITYAQQETRLPRLKLVWTVSKRTISKLKPSTKVLLDLETIDEDEVVTDSSAYSSSVGSCDDEMLHARATINGFRNPINIAAYASHNGVDDDLGADACSVCLDAANCTCMRDDEDDVDDGFHEELIGSFDKNNNNDRQLDKRGGGVIADMADLNISVFSVESCAA